MSPPVDLFDKLRPIAASLAALPPDTPVPFDTCIDEVLGPCEVVISGRRTLMFGSNNYLGLSFHPEVIAAGQLALRQSGNGTTGSRLANGTLSHHVELERDFVNLFAHAGIRQAKIFTTGYQANLSLIAGLAGPEDTVILDAESHASIWDGARLSGAPILAFRHNSAADLAKKLKHLTHGQTNRLVVVEGLYSIRGDVAPLEDMVQVCREYGAYLMVDEAHSFGTVGPRGLGYSDEQGVLSGVDFVVGTFSKSLAGVGGFAVSRHDELALLHFASRSYVFSASGSPANIAGVKAALAVMVREPERRELLWGNIHRARAGLQKLGFKIGAKASPIVPIWIGDRERTIAFWQALLGAGLYVNIVVPPGCPSDECLLRTSYSTAHTSDQIDQALRILGDTGQRLGLL